MKRMLIEGLLFCCLTASSSAAPVQLSDQRLDDVTAGTLTFGVDLSALAASASAATHFDPELLASINLSNVVMGALEVNYATMSPAQAAQALAASTLRITIGNSVLVLPGADLVPMLGYLSTPAAAGLSNSANVPAGSMAVISRNATSSLSVGGVGTTTTMSSTTAVLH